MYIYSILIVDDEKGITAGLRFLIEKSFPQCIVAGIGYNGLEGFNLAMESKPDIILTDIRMPQVNGLEMVRMLKENNITSNVIILSGYSDFEYAKKGIELGVKFYITKPVEEEELFDSLKKAFENIDSERKQNRELHYLKSLFSGSSQNINEIEEILKEDISRLESYIDVMDIHGCNTTIQEILTKITMNKSFILSDMKLQCLSILLHVIRKIPDGQFQLKDYLGKDVLSPDGISRFQSVDQVENWMINSFRSIIELNASPEIHVRKDIITEIKEYISMNYNKAISLSDLANRFFMSSGYLSQLFKEKTGETYLKFIMKLRINKAKELLSKTDLKVYEVCELVGYFDTNYFSKLFEKLVGCTPSAYKKNKE